MGSVPVQKSSLQVTWNINGSEVTVFKSSDLINPSVCVHASSSYGDVNCSLIGSTVHTSFKFSPLVSTFPVSLQYGSDKKSTTIMVQG